MTTVYQWYGAGVADGTLTTSTAGTGDTAFSAVASSVTVASEKIVFASTTAGRTATWSGLALSAAAVRYYVTIGSTFALVPILNFWTSAPARICGVTMNSTPVFTLRNSANSAVATSGTFTAGDYIIDLLYDSATGNGRAIVYNADGSTFWDSGAQAVTSSTAVGRVIIGRDSSTAAGPLTVDNILLTNTAAPIGPYTDPVAGVVTVSSGAQGVLDRSAAAGTVAATAAMTGALPVSQSVGVVTISSAAAGTVALSTVSGVTQATSALAGTLDRSTLTGAIVAASTTEGTLDPPPDAGISGAVAISSGTAGTVNLSQVAGAIGALAGIVGTVSLSQAAGTVAAVVALIGALPRSQASGVVTVASTVAMIDPAAPTPPERRATIPAESRRTTIAAEQRRSTLPADPRLTLVDAESRTRTIPAEHRTTEAQ